MMNFTKIFMYRRDIHILLAYSSVKLATKTLLYYYFLCSEIK